MTNKLMEELIEQKEQYRLKIVELAKERTKKVGYHFNCPDGIVSASIMKYVFSFEELIYIPIDYPLLKDREVLEYFSTTNWFAIVDLSPFNTDVMEYYFDHHISNLDKKIKAKHYVFDHKAPSAASLIASYFSDKIPDFLKELADITEITDTASYKTPAPLEVEQNYEDLSWDEKIWFLEDVCKSSFTIEEHNQIIDILTAYGLKGLWNEDILNRVRELRNSRKIAYEIAEGVILKDFIIIIDTPLHFNTAYIAREVMRRGAKGAAYITEYPDVIKLSLRLNRVLTAEEVENYRVDHLAEQMEGGGHKGASGAEAENLEFVMEKIVGWAETKNLRVEIIDLKEK